MISTSLATTEAALVQGVVAAAAVVVVLVGFRSLCWMPS
jgi:hypothetical protein